tara:strand:+ start:42 stop:2123 length:2082 start_codon:yes stop_codon:yes gene_type:complete
MRSEKINHLFASISTLPGIGPKLENLFKRLVGIKLIDLLWHTPYNLISYSKYEDLNEAEINTLVTIKISINKHNPSRFKRQPYKVNCTCNNMPIDIIYFNARHPVIKSTLPIGEDRYVSGKLDYYKNSFQITHPSNIFKVEDIEDVKDNEPIYSLTAGLNQKIFYKNIQKILPKLPNLDEWIDNNILNKYSFLPWKESLIAIHNPKSNDDLLNSNINRRRLAFDELLSHQLAISIVRNYNKKFKGIKFKSSNSLLSQFIDSLPFKLTASQQEVWQEINKDLESSNQMLRLLQGDVGSGKTIIALLASLKAIESGYQSSILVPTSILAQQHFNTARKLLKNFSINILILTGRDKGSQKIEKLKKIENGKANLIIGTHALIQENVNFKSIGLVIIDEQHRFGVYQRMTFTHKGKKPSIIVMSATPIPRTLTLAAYGDMDESKITEKPMGRLPIITTSLTLSKTEILIQRLKKKLKNNEKTYWVCPLIQESEELDLKAANERYKNLTKEFDEKVLLIHGQLKEKEKETIMEKFKNEDYKILVSTTIIEVGIDIPDANIIIIEHAERFGLAQLHQLRGRVGRNNTQSNCVLLHKDQIGLTAKKRISKMKETNDGFEIAKEDLKIRGSGEILGVKQSGMPSFKIADLSYDEDLLEDARNYVKKITDINPKLKNKEGESLRNLLYLHEKDIAVKTLQAG